MHFARHSDGGPKCVLKTSLLRVITTFFDNFLFGTRAVAPHATPLCVNRHVAAQCVRTSDSETSTTNQKIENGTAQFFRKASCHRKCTARTFVAAGPQNYDMKSGWSVSVGVSWGKFVLEVALSAEVLCYSFVATLGFCSDAVSL